MTIVSYAFDAPRKKSSLSNQPSSLEPEEAFGSIVTIFSSDQVDWSNSGGFFRCLLSTNKSFLKPILVDSINMFLKTG